MVQLDVGSDKGLSPNHTLVAYRVAPTPTYLGVIRIVDVAAAPRGRQAGAHRRRPHPVAAAGRRHRVKHPLAQVSIHAPKPRGASSSLGGKAGTIMAEIDEQDTSVATNDAYTGMLAISLVALLLGCALLYLDYDQYGGKDPPKVSAPDAEVQPADHRWRRAGPARQSHADAHGEAANAR